MKEPKTIKIKGNKQKNLRKGEREVDRNEKKKYQKHKEIVNLDKLVNQFNDELIKDNIALKNTKF